MDDVNFVELASCVRPTGRLVDVAAVEMMEAGIGVSLQGTLEVFQMLPRMFPSAVFRICEPDGWRCGFTTRPVVAHVRPETSGFGLAVTRGKHWDGSIVGMHLAPAKHMPLKRTHQWVKQITRCANPSGQRGTGYLNPLPGVN